MLDATELLMFFRFAHMLDATELLMFFRFAHMLDATELLMFSRVCTHVGCTFVNATQPRKRKAPV